MDKECKHCKALKFKGEPEGLCCNSGKVVVPPIPTPPEPLHSLLFVHSRQSTDFLKNIMRYNAAFQMTSFVADKRVFHGHFQPTFKVQGQVYHLLGSPLPLPGKPHNFLQLYFIEGDHPQQSRRQAIVEELDSQIVTDLQHMLHNNNDLVKQFKAAVNGISNTTEYRVSIAADHKPPGQHPRTWNAPTTREVAVIAVGQPTDPRDIVLKTYDDKLLRIAEDHKFYDALQYPLILWNGQPSYCRNILLVDPTSKMPLKTKGNKEKHVTASDFYAYLLMYRNDDSNVLLRFQKLLNQFLVDMWVKAETIQLRYLSTHQKELRADEYVNLKDAIASDRNVNPTDLGKNIILPSSHVNSPRYLHEYAQDAITYARVFHRSALFLTFTCNPSWHEIKAALLPHQQTQHRQDIVARVFRQKVRVFVDVLTKGNVFGQTSAFVYSIEWQKRGLPHCHLLLWLSDLVRPNHLDDIISAELPDRQIDPRLFDVILNNMVHGPCGAANPHSPCMEKGKCTKKYPRSFVQETRIDSNSYPLYKRRAPEHGGITATIPMKTKNVKGSETTVHFEIDNRWVVPYSPILSNMFNAHINVEFCSSERAIKYICKYMTKGIDFAAFNLIDTSTPHPRDEIKTYAAGRYVDSNMAAWRLFKFPLHERHPAVSRLHVHLENGQRVYFRPSTFQQRVTNPPNSSLTAFFNLCTEDPFATTLLYSEVPQYYTWNNTSKLWQRRKQGEPVPGWDNIYKGRAVSRIYTVHVRQFECFCLRLLLLHTRGPTSFATLRTVENTEHPTYQEACRALGLLMDDNHWDAAMEEATIYRRPSHIRHLFSILLSMCGLSDPTTLWNKYKDPMSEDYLFKHRRQHPDRQFDDYIYNDSLIDIEDLVMGMCGKQVKDFGLTSPARDIAHNTLVEKELAYNHPHLETFVSSNYPLLNDDQKRVFNFVNAKLDANEPAFIFVQAAGGTGKSHLLNLILAHVRSKGDIALAVASSGIAGTVLTGGRTAHSVLQLPLDLQREEMPTCNITKQSARGQLLRQCKLLVWDEATMSHKRAFEAMDRCLRDIRNDTRIMGGLVVVLAGDFRQTLPVIPKGTLVDEFDACLKSSDLWDTI